MSTILEMDKFPSFVSVTEVLYMSFDRFLLAVESRDLSQADKILIRVSSFPKLSDKSERIERIHFAESSGLSC